MRRHVGVALLDGVEDPARALRRALRGGTRTIVVDGLDAALGTGARDQLAAALRDAARTRPATIIASAKDADAARSLLAEAGRDPVQTLTVTTPASSPEVNA